MARAGKGTTLWDLVKLEYAYDDSSNVTSITDFRNKTSGVAQQQCYEYDDLGRMTSGHTQANGTCTSYGATGTAPFDVTMTFSPSGNIESMTDPVRGIDWDYDYTADPHQVTQVDDGVGGVDASFVYDGNGSMKTRTVGSTSQTLQYDENGRLDKVKVGGSAQAEFLYDAAGNRVRTIQGGVTTFFVGDYEWASSSDWKRNYRAAGMLVAVDDDGDLWWTMDDHLGSAGVQYKVSGDQVLRQRYDPWGLIRDTDGLVTDIGYTSQRLDQATGLMYYQARYYDPMIGRFTSPDSIVPNPAIGQDYNRYTYVRNNPLRYTDPSGNTGVAACALSGPFALVCAATASLVTVAVVAGAAAVAYVANEKSKYSAPPTAVSAPYDGPNIFWTPQYEGAAVGGVLPPTSTLGGVSLWDPGIDLSPDVADAVRDLLTLAETPLVPQLDESGKIHSAKYPIPAYVPAGWTLEQLLEAKENLEASIAKRAKGHDDHGHDPGHEKKRQEELEFLRKVEKVLSGT